MTDPTQMTCLTCQTTREAPPFEDYLANSHETMGFCANCRTMTKHVVGIALVKTEKTKKRKVRS